MSLYTRLRKVYRLLRDRERYFNYEQEYKRLSPFNAIVPIGHYESPYPSTNELEMAYDKGFESKLLGIDLNKESQICLYKEMESKINEAPMVDKEKNLQYRFYDFGDNVWFGRDDARVLYAILKHFKPKNIIEIGSGFSTALILDVNEKLEYCMNITCIEPRPARLKSLLRQNDHINILEQDVQEISLDTFASINGGGGIMKTTCYSLIARMFVVPLEMSIMNSLKYSLDLRKEQ